MYSLDYFINKAVQFYLQDNDLKHKSVSTKNWMTEKNIIPNQIMEAPPSSPDLNSIENVWGHMKRHLNNTVKPKKKDDLVKAVAEWWENTMTIEECSKFINHLEKALPVVILANVGATGYRFTKMS